MPADNRDVDDNPVAGRRSAHVVADGGPASRACDPEVRAVYGLVVSHGEHLGAGRGANLDIGGRVISRVALRRRNGVIGTPSS
jgi:hypothetical protein